MRAQRLAGLVNLNHPGHFINWGVIQISYANAIVVGLMVATFVAALLLPFPGHKDGDES
jgi:hypothetical protein